MRCKKCAKTFRSPPQRMKETQICAECSKTNFPTRKDVKEGSRVMIEKKSDKDTGILTEGIVQNILTPGNYHPNGLMVDLQNGKRGRVKKVLDKEPIKKADDFSSSKNTDTIVTKGSGRWVEDDSTSDTNHEDINEISSITTEKEAEYLTHLRKNKLILKIFILFQFETN